MKEDKQLKQTQELDEKPVTSRESREKSASSQESSEKEIAKAELQPTNNSSEKPITDTEKKQVTKTKKPESKAHKAKAKKIKDLAEKIKNSKTLMIVSIKNLPSKQFQDIKKSIREHALVQVAKKNIMLRAIKKVGKQSILDLENYISKNYAFVISNIEGFELAGILSQKKTPVSAKAGQIALDDIKVKAGPTDLIPGPAISELGALRIQISIEEGKILIKAPKTIVKKGGGINEATASLLQKLHIQPFKVGLEPIAIYDIQTEKIYSNIKIDSEETAENLKSAHAKAICFAQKIIYYCKETIGYLLAKANSERKGLEKLKPAEPVTSQESREKSVSSQESSEKEIAKAELQPTNSSSEKPIIDTGSSSKKPIIDTEKEEKAEKPAADTEKKPEEKPIASQESSSKEQEESEKLDINKTELKENTQIKSAEEEK